ncbi:MAG: polymer-forming cytoskeletal protein [Rhodospirillales bacterium]|nr:polymer-forming cytoskeletal protein [Rhodospirillales bacterium]
MTARWIRHTFSGQDNMFSRNKSANGNGHAPRKNSVPSILSADLKIVGDVISEGEIHVEGSVDGDVRTTRLMVGENAVIRGEIEAEDVLVHGTVTGHIKAKSVELTRTARVSGDIIHAELAIERGAFLEGHCKRLVEETESKDVEPTRLNLVKDGTLGTVPVANVECKKLASGA